MPSRNIAEALQTAAARHKLSSAREVKRILGVVVPSHMHQIVREETICKSCRTRYEQSWQMKTSATPPSQPVLVTDARKRHLLHRRTRTLDTFRPISRILGHDRLVRSSPWPPEVATRKVGDRVGTVGFKHLGRCEWCSEPQGFLPYQKDTGSIYRRHAEYMLMYAMPLS